MEETTTPVEEKAPETTATSSEEAKEASSKEATTVVSTYQPEEKKTVSTTYAAPAAPDYAGLALAKSENAGLQPQTAAFKEEIANLFGITSLVVTVQGTVEITEKVWLSTLWYQKAQN